MALDLAKFAPSRHNPGMKKQHAMDCLAESKRWLMATAVLFVVVAMTNDGSAQAPTTIQLPTFRQFRVDSSVMVPVGGSASLGGVRRSQTGVTNRGVPIVGRVPGIGGAFNNRGIGFTDGTAQARVHATLIDLEAMDRAIRSSPEAQRFRERMGMAGAGVMRSDVTVPGGRSGYL